MSNCNFTQLSTYFDIQINLSNFLRNNPTLSTEELIPSVEGFMVNYLQHNLKEELTPDILNYMHGAVSTLFESINIAIEKDSRSHGYPLSIQEDGPFSAILHNKLRSFYINKPGYLKNVEKGYVNLKAVTIGSTTEKKGKSTKVQLTSGENETTPIVPMNFSGNPGYVRKVDVGVVIKKVGDVDRMFKGAINAQNRLNKILASNLINKYLVHADNRYNVTESEVDLSVKNYKQDLFKELVAYVNVQDKRKGKNKIDGNYYESLNNHEFVSSKVPDSLNQIKAYYEGLSLTAGTLEAWDIANPEALKQYINYIMISNFDNLLQISGEGIFKIASSTFNNNLETKGTIKYRLKLVESITSGYNADEMYALLGEQTPIYKRFLSAIPHIKRDGSSTDLHKWDISSINAIVARLFQDIRDENRKFIVYDKSDALHSMTEVFEFFLKNHFNPGVMDFSGSKPYSPGEQEMLLSIYLTFFANKNSKLDEILGKDLASKVKQYANTSLYTLDANTHNYTINPAFSPVNIIVSNFNKTYFNRYTQIVYNKDSRGLMFETIDGRVYETDIIFLKNTINGFINLPISKDTFAREVDVNANNGIVTFNLNAKETVTVDLTKGTVTYYSGSTLKKIELLVTNEKFLNLAHKLLKIPVHNYNILGAISIEKDQGGWVNTITAIGKLMASSAMIREIVKQPKASREAFINKNTYLSSRPADLYNADFNSYLIQSMHGSAGPDIESIARAFSTVSGALYKAVATVASGKTMPLHAEARHLYVLHEMMDYLENENGVYYDTFPLKGNIFFNNRGLLQSPVIRTYIRDMDNFKHSSELSPVEFMTTNMMHEYLGSLNLSTTAQEPVVYIQPTVFTDKNMHYLLPIKLNNIVNVNGIKKRLGSFGTKDFHDVMFSTGESYYQGLAARIVNSYIPVLRSMGIDTTKIEKADPLKAVPMLDKVLGTLDVMVVKKAFLDINGDTVPLMDELSYRTKPVFGLSETLVEYTKIYSDRKRFEKFVQRSKDYFSRDLTDMKFQMEYYDNGGNITPVFNGLFSATSVISKEDFEKDWVNSSGYAVNSKDGVLNPLLENYFLMHAMISDNYEQISMGTIHNHPSKGDKAIPANATAEERMDHLISFKKKAKFKRELAGTPGKPMNQNIINGSAPVLKVVSISDIKLPVHNLFGITDTMTTSDGAKLTPMIQIILQNNSFQDNQAGLTQKILSSTLDPHFMGLDQDKSAEHPITNEVTRRSQGSDYNLKVLTKKALSIPFTEVTGTAQNINILRSYNGNTLNVDDIAPDGIFFARWNPLKKEGASKKVKPGYDIIRLASIKTMEENQGFYNKSLGYTFTYTNLSDGTQTEESKPINNLYELWEMLGAENSVSINDDGHLSAQGNTFTFSDSSNYVLVNIINAVGTWTTPAGLKIANVTESFLRGKNKRILKTNSVRDLVPTQKTVWQPLKEAFYNTYAFASGEKSGAKSTQNVKQVFTDDNIRPIAFSQNTLSTFLLLNSEHESENSQLSEMSQIIAALVFNSETLPEARRAYSAIGKLIEVKLKKLLNGLKEFETTGNKDTLYKYVVKILVDSFTERDQKSIAGLLANIANTDSISDGDVSGMLNMEVNNMPFSSYIYKQFNSMLASTISKDAIKRKFSGLAGPIKTSGGFIKVFDVKDATGKIRTVTSELFHTKYGAIVSEEPVNVDDVALYDWVRVNGEETYLDSILKLLKFRREGGGVDSIIKLYGKPRELKPYEVTFSVMSNEVPGEVLYPKYSVYNTFEFQAAFGLMDLATRGVLSPEAQMCLTNPVITQLLQSTLGPHEASMEFYQANADKVQLLSKKLVQTVQRRLTVDRKIYIDGVSYDVTGITTTSGEAMGPNIHRTKFGLPEGISIDDITVQTFVDNLNKKSAPKTRGAQQYLVNADGNHLYFFSNEEYQVSKEARFRDVSVEVKQIGDATYIVDEDGDTTYTLPEGVSYHKYVDASGEIVNALVYDTDVALTDFIFANKINRKELYSTDSYDIKKLASKHLAIAQKMYSSFQVSLEYTSARIPGQGPQSFTPLRIVDFSHEQNTILTNHFTTWLKGEDYDIDKGFWLGTEIGKNGMISAWSKLFDYSSPEALKLSMNLPVSTGETPYSSNGTILTDNDIVILNSASLTKEKVELLHKISEETIQYPFVTDEEMEAMTDEQRSAYGLIDDFFMEELSTQQLENGYKNVIARNMFNMIASPLNQVHAESPVTFGELEVFKNQIVPKIMSPLSPTTNATIQDANMVGKDVVGIAAVGLKVWSVLTYWGNHKMLEGKMKDIVIGKEYIINGRAYPISTIANLNFNNGRTLDEILPELQSALMNKMGTMGDSTIDLTAYMSHFFMQAGLSEDQSLVISSVLSAATDNAKELILQEVNGGQLTAGVYIYLAMMGVELKDIIQFMNNPAVKKITELARKNIYDDSTEYASIKSALKYFRSGPKLGKEPRPFNLPFSGVNNPIWSAMRSYPNWNREQIAFLKGLDAKGQPDKTVPKFKVSWIGFKTMAELEGATPKNLAEVIRKYTDWISAESTGKVYTEGLPTEEEEYNEEASYTVVKVGVVINRFLDRINTFATEINILPANEVQMFAEIVADAGEIALLGKVLSSNQGVKPNAYEQYSFLLEYNEMMKERIAGDEESPFDVEKAAIKSLVDLRAAGFMQFGDPELAENIKRMTDMMLDFTFEDYIKAMNVDPNSDYVRIHKILGKNFSRVVNILDIVDYVPHYKKMLFAISTMESTKDALTIRDRSINELIKELHRSRVLLSNTHNPPKLKEDQYLKLQTIFNDILAVKWLRSLKDDKRLLKTKVFEEVILKDGKFTTVEYPNGKVIIVDLGTSTGRANFTKVFQSMILDLKENPTYAENSFIQNLGIDYADDPISGETYEFFRLPINLMNIGEHNINEFSKYVTDFNELNANQFGDNTIKDLFFIYTMLIHRDQANKSSFTKLFEKSTVASEDSLMKGYITTIAELDLSNDFLKNELAQKNLDGDYTLADLLSRAISPKLDTTGEDDVNSNYVGEYGHTVRKEGKKKKITFYKWAQVSESEDGKPKGAYVIDQDYITQFTAIPMSIDFPTTIELVNTMKMQRRENIREAVKIADNFITELTINCE